MIPSAALTASWSALKFAGMLTEATWSPLIGASVAADVIFDAPGVAVLDAVSVTDPSVRFRASDLPGLLADSRGRLVVAGRGTFNVHRAEPLDDGLTARAWLTTLPTS